MTDIMFIEKEKLIIRIALKMVRKKIGKCATAEAIQEEMEHCANPAIREIAKLIKERCNQLEPKWQRDMSLELSFFFLWVLLHDTAYRDIAFAILDDILKDSKNLRTLIRPFVKPPEKWYPNVWHNSKKTTAKQRAEGKIPAYEHSIAERQCHPVKHRQDLQQIVDRMRKV